MRLRALLAILPSVVLAGNTVNLQQIPLATTNPSKEASAPQPPYWYETIKHNGEASFMQPSCKSSYQVFRNVVTDFGADNTGKTDASKAIQDAINGTSSSLLFNWTSC